MEKTPLGTAGWITIDRSVILCVYPELKGMHRCVGTAEITSKKWTSDFVHSNINKRVRDDHQAGAAYKLERTVVLLYTVSIWCFKAVYMKFIIGGICTPSFSIRWLWFSPNIPNEVFITGRSSCTTVCHQSWPGGCSASSIAVAPPLLHTIRILQIYSSQFIYSIPTWVLGANEGRRLWSPQGCPVNECRRRADMKQSLHMCSLFFISQYGKKMSTRKRNCINCKATWTGNQLKASKLFRLLTFLLTNYQQGKVTRPMSVVWDRV